jgi:hypothetical protein
MAAACCGNPYTGDSVVMRAMIFSGSPDAAPADVAALDVDGADVALLAAAVLVAPAAVVVAAAAVVGAALPPLLLSDPHAAPRNATAASSPTVPIAWLFTIGVPLVAIDDRSPESAIYQLQD